MHNLGGGYLDFLNSGGGDNSENLGEGYPKKNCKNCTGDEAIPSESS